MKRILSLIAVLFLAGCTSILTPTQRLTLALNGYNTAQESATILHRDDGEVFLL